MKKIAKGKILVWSGIIAVVLGIAGFAAIKISDVIKNDRVVLSQDPEIGNSARTYQEMSEEDRNSLMAGFGALDNEANEAEEEPEEIPQVVEEKKPRQEKREEVVAVQDKLFERVDKIEDKPAPKPRVQPKKEPVKEERDHNVRFNFVIVKDDDVLNQAVKEEVGGSASARDNVRLYKAKVYGRQKVKNNEPIIIRNVEELTVTSPRRVIIPPNSILYGTCRLISNRMHVMLTSAATMNGDFSIDLDVYDADYIKGIFVRDGIETGVEQSTDRVIDDVATAIPNQVAGAVVRNTTRQMQRSLARQERVSVVLVDGYELMIGVPIEVKK
jgi:hypothetical protein